MIAVAVFAALLLSFALTGLARHYAERRNLVDVPNSRSSHALPTPRGGGVGFVVVYLVALALLHLAGLLPADTWLAVSGAGAAVAVIGFVDDHAPVAAKVRFLVHVVAAAWVVGWLGVDAATALGSAAWPRGLAEISTVLFIIWLLNLYNFMDGTDGLAGIETVTVGLSAALLALVASPDTQGWLPPLLLAATVGGFLVWNVPPARIFMGDVGSGFIGVCVAALALDALSRSAALFWAWIILLGAFVVDATFTLLRRVARGRTFYAAHRSHAYQHAARRFGHRAVMLAVGGINVLWLMPIAWLVAAGRLSAVIGLIVAYCPLVGLAAYFRAGSES